MSRLGEKINASAKEIAGDITDNDRLRIKGKLGHMAANMKDWADDARDAVTGRIHGAEAPEKHIETMNDEEL